MAGDGDDDEQLRVYAPVTIISVCLGVLAFVGQILIASSAVYNHKEYLLSASAGSPLPRLMSRKSGTSSSSGSNSTKKRCNNDTDLNTMSSGTNQTADSDCGGGTPDSVSSNRRRQRVHILKMRRKREQRLNKERIQTKKSFIYVSLELSLFFFNALATLVWAFMRSNWMNVAQGRSKLSKGYCVAVLTSQSVLFLLAKMSLHLILVYRLHFTFQRSSVQMKLRHLQYFAAAVVSEIMLAGVFQVWFISQEATVAETNMGGMQVCTLSALIHKTNGINPKFGMDDITSLTFAFIDAIIYILTIALFVERMKKLRLHVQDQRIAIVTRKITVLGSVNICLNMCVFLVLIPIYPRGLVLVPLAALFDSLSIYLIPKHSHSQYNLLCHPCDQAAIAWADFWPEKSSSSHMLPPPMNTLGKRRFKLPSKSSDDRSSRIHRHELSLESLPSNQFRRNNRRGVSAKLAHRPTLTVLHLENNRTASTESSSFDKSEGFTITSGPVPNFTDTPSLGPIVEERCNHEMMIDHDHLTIMDAGYASSSHSGLNSEDEKMDKLEDNEEDEDDDHHLADTSPDSTDSSRKLTSFMSSVDLETVNESRENTPNRESLKKKKLHLKYRVEP